MNALPKPTNNTIEAKAAICSAPASAKNSTNANPTIIITKLR